MIPYEPREDSFLLQKYVKKLAKGIVLDVGTGSGIQALTAGENSKVNKVYAVDVDEEVIQHCKNAVKSEKIIFLQSDLFQNIIIKFDIVIFNPPYLPQESDSRDIRLEGGKKGYEVIGRFLSQVNNYLIIKGCILLLFSSLTNKDKVIDLIEQNLFDYEELEKSHVFFEDLFVYKITKSKILQALEKKEVSNVSYFTHGKRGMIFTGMHNNKKVAVKIKKKESEAINTIKKEYYMLKLLNKHKIGPKFIFADDDFLVYEFIDGIFIRSFFETASRDRIINVLKNVFLQCFKLDKLKINKEEMHHPDKHILINNNVVFIDFERARRTIDPKNVSQFCQYVMINKELLNSKGFNINEKDIIKSAKEYKSRMSLKNLDKILALIR